MARILDVNNFIKELEIGSRSSNVKVKNIILSFLIGAIILFVTRPIYIYKLDKLDKKSRKPKLSYLRASLVFLVYSALSYVVLLKCF